jgi:hypothetical protein
VFFHKVQDNRPYIHVEIAGKRILALLDSGANQTILGQEGLSLLEELKFKMRRVLGNFSLQTADGAAQSLLGQVVLPLCIEGVTKELSVLVSDTISVGLTLGMDCCYLFGLEANFRQDTFSVPAAVNTLEVIHTRANLTDKQTRALEVVIEQFKVMGSEGLGRTALVTHRIDTGDAVPFKQRYYPMSPAMLEAMNKEIDQMLNLGVIRPSSSPWNSPSV